MEEKQSRVRWDDQELSRLAAVMAPRLLAEPHLPPLDAVRAAQDCLEPGRRRELKAWSLVEGRLQPKLDEAMARLRAQSSQPAGDEGQSQLDSSPPLADGSGGGADAEEQPCVTSLPPVAAQDAGSAQPDALGRSDESGEGVQAYGGRGAVTAMDAAATPGKSLALFDDAEALAGDPRAERGAATATAAHEPSEVPPPAAVAASATGQGEPVQRAASMTLEPARIEAALVAALQSPAVEEALVELFARTLSKALLRAGTGELRSVPAHSPRQSPARRVLLAGFPDAQQKALMEALGASFAVRSWKPANGPQLFQTLARLCKTVVFPEDADDDVDAGLKDMDVRVIRHAGNACRLIERIGELG